MIAPELVTVEEKVSAVKCTICKKGEKSDFRIKKLGRTIGVVCHDCIEGFTDKDLELMHNMFTAYGGHFGELGGSKEETYKRLKEIAMSYKEEGKAASGVVNDVQTLHRAFLYGIPLYQLVGGLRALLE